MQSRKMSADDEQVEADALCKRFLDVDRQGRKRIPGGGSVTLKDTNMYRKWQPERIDLASLLHIEQSTSVTTLEFETVGLTGDISGYKEVTRSINDQIDAKSSTSLQRAPADYSSFVRGKSGYFPFTPGSNVVPDAFETEDGSTDVVESMEKALDLASGGLKTIPPGFEYGLDFEDDDSALPEDDFGEVVPIYRPTNAPNAAINGSDHSEAYIDAELAKLLPTERMTNFDKQNTAIKRRKAVVAKRDWAHVVDVNQELANFHDLVPDMAKEYPFELDTFQKEAVYHMEQGDSVFVAAHTSAGKTVVAEYAIALAIKHMTRAIYTSPIKALSNQKFRDFKETFGLENVGILTGDVQINPEASCLIMTTEILRSMLYKGADLIRDIEWVIFDEVHYVNDLERGVVWEEVIIMLPEHVGIVLLSATVPNTKEFANWVGRTQQKDIYVISTPKRPVPLEHFLYAGREMHLVLDSRGQEHLSQGVKDANEALKRKQEKEREAAIAASGGVKPRGAQQAGRGASGRGGSGNAGTTFTRGRGGGRTMAQQDRNLWIHLVGILRKKELLPVVIFTFSKRRCEENAASMPNTDLCTAAERSEVHIVIERSLTRLKEIDRKLPQIRRMRDLLSRGIGVHHGGLLPIVKEVVEILFARGLVKVLFATETFAMGVNMPAKCVVFSNIRKHDGRTFRDLLAGEYTQMSGRAGRRGLDKTGVVLIVCDGDVPDSATLHKLLLGSATKLTSQFRLTYTMILNLLRVEALKVEDVIRRSFSENASQRLLPDQQKKVTESEKRLGEIPDLRASPNYQAARESYLLLRELVELNTSLLLRVSQHAASSKILAAGRVVAVRNGAYTGNPAFILRQTSSLDAARSFIVLIFRLEMQLPSESGHALAPAPVWPASLSAFSDRELFCEVTQVSIFDINFVTKWMAKVDVGALLDSRKQSALVQATTEMQNILKSVSAETLHDEISWDRIRDIEFRELLMNREAKWRALRKIQLDTESFEVLKPSLHLEHVLQSQIADLRLSLSDQNLELLPEYQQMTEVLRDLRFIDDNGTIQLKGRVACEINSVNELILTELILDNILASYEPAEVVAMLSALVFREKSNDAPVLTPRLEEAVGKMRRIAERIGEIQRLHKIETAEDASKSNDLRLGMMEVTYEWARGMPFHQITDLTDVQEGTIVHTITRLDETCREVRDAARIIGDASLYQKMEACQNLIKRDIVFAASLYL